MVSLPFDKLWVSGSMLVRWLLKGPAFARRPAAREGQFP